MRNEKGRQNPSLVGCRSCAGHTTTSWVCPPGETGEHVRPTVAFAPDWLGAPYSIKAADRSKVTSSASRAPLSALVEERQCTTFVMEARSY